MLIAPSYGADTWDINDIAVLTDPLGTESIESVSQPNRATDFLPVPYGFSAGFTRSVHWLRFTLQAPPKNKQGKREIFLEIHPPYLDDLQIYLSQSKINSGFETRRAGDLQPHATKEYPYRAFVFPIDFDDANPRTAYVRLQTTSTSVLAVRAWEPNRFIAETSREYILLGIMVGVFMAGLIANIWQGLWRHESIHRRYIIYAASVLVNIIGINGLAGEFLFPNTPFLANHWVSIAVLLSVIFGTRFYILALDIDNAPLWMRYAYYIQYIAAIISLPTPFLGFYSEAAKIIFSIISVTLIIGIIRSIQLWQQHNSNGKILLLANLLSAVGRFSAIPTLLGILPGQFQIIYSYQLTFGSLLALQLILTQRVRTIQAKLNQAKIETEITKATAQQERAEHDNQRHFLSMLTHELKTPLSVIRMRLGSKAPTLRMQRHAAQAVQDIDAIGERCAMVSRIDERSEKLQLAPCDVNKLLDDILSKQQTARAITLNLAENATSISVQSDPVFLRTILSNLIDNAVKYSPPKGIIKINLALGVNNSTTQVGNSKYNGLYIKIENDIGVAGVPDPAYIFEKYYRAPGAHQQSGTGLGLYIGKALTEQLGGTINCQPQVGLIIFTLWLPF